MWSIIAFRDNSVEVVPSKWYDSGVCAWPKRNLKQCIDQQLSPNLKEFRYLKGRKLGNDTSMLNTLYIIFKFDKNKLYKYACAIHDSVMFLFIF